MSYAERKRRAIACILAGDMRGFERHAGVLDVMEIVRGRIVQTAMGLRIIEIYKGVPLWDVRAHVRRGVKVKAAA